MSNKPWQVSTPVERGDKTYWTRIGSAWPSKNGSGGFNVVLDALPVNGKIAIQPPFEEGDRAPRGGNKGASGGGGFDDDNIPF